MPINFHFQNIDVSLNQEKTLKDYIIHLFKEEGISVKQIDYIFCTDEFLLPLNKKYLNHDTYTDILTFDLSEKDAKMMAEIYISVDRVKENTKIFKTSFQEELHRVIFHGALHLCGYNDHSEDEKKLMRQKEDEKLKAYFK